MATKRHYWCRYIVSKWKKILFIFRDRCFLQFAFSQSVSLIVLPFKYCSLVHLTAMFVKQFLSPSLSNPICIFVSFITIPVPYLLEFFIFSPITCEPVQRFLYHEVIFVGKTLYLPQKFGQPLSIYCSTMRLFRYIESSTEINVKSPPYWSAISKCLLPVSATDWNPLVIDL
jgi:hypothetical protein